MTLLSFALFEICGCASALTMKEAANGIRDGIQSALQSRHSRLSVDLPPGAILALRNNKIKDDDPIRKADLVLADYVSALFPGDISTAKVFVDPIAARKGGGTRIPKNAKKKNKATTTNKGFGGAASSAGAPKKPSWCPNLGLDERRDVVLIVGSLSNAEQRRNVAEASRNVGQDTAMVLLNARLPGLTAFPVVEDEIEGYVPVFSLSPPKALSSGDENELDRLVVYRIFPDKWTIVDAGDSDFFASLTNAAKQAVALKTKTTVLWTGDSPPSDEDSLTAARELVA